MAAEEPSETTVCVTDSAQQADERAVVLAAIGIAHRVERTAAGWTVMVAADDAVRATGALAAYDEENREEAAVETVPPAHGTPWIGGLIAALLVGIFAVTRPGAPGAVWIDRGSASAREILAGEVWRTVTALTLHVDVAHLLGNVVGCLVLVTAVCRWLGPGSGTWLVLLSGAAGNGLTALARGAPHVSVGASTAIFGALGILAVRQFAVRRRRRAPGRGAWVVIAATLVLLSALGAGPRSDVLAHVFGLLVGAALGLVSARARRRPADSPGQWRLAVAAGGLVLACWWIALTRAGGA